MATIFGVTNFFLKIGSATHQSYHVVQNFVKIALSNTVFKIQTFLCFAFWKKNLKIQNGRHFWWVKYLLKLGKASLHRYPVGQNFCQNHYLIFEIQDFVKNAKNPKWPPFLAGQNFFFLKLGQLLRRFTPWIKIFIKIALTSIVFEIQAFSCFAFLKKIWKFKMATIFGEWKIL